MDIRNTGDTPVYWFDMTTLIAAIGRQGARPTGIARVVAEVAAHLQIIADPSVKLCTFHADSKMFREVTWQEMDRIFAAANAEPSSQRKALAAIRGVIPDWLGRRLRIERRISRTLRYLKSLFETSSQATRSASGFRHPFREGDSWVNLGLWFHEGIHEAVSCIKECDAPIRSVNLIHDCIPLYYPEFFPAVEARRWQREIPKLNRCSDIVLVNSENTQRDICELLPDIRNKVRRIRFGDSKLSVSLSEENSVMMRRFGIDRPFILFVSTIEVRKNHALVVRAWRQLMREGDADLPLLVFAGRWGWKTKDLRAQLEETNGLDGSVKIVESPSDAQLAALYRCCTGTIYPSHYEGWGLPVRESLSFGKPCVTASNSSLSEAGEGLADFFESNCEGDLVRKVRETLLDPDKRYHRSSQIAEKFRPIEWSVTVQDIIKSLDK